MTADIHLVDLAICAPPSVMPLDDIPTADELEHYGREREARQDAEQMVERASGIPAGRVRGGEW